jgi:acyl-CoA dehydrogenase
MAWDFSTDEQYEEQLAWMRDFVREEVFPINSWRRWPRSKSR